MAEDEPSGPRFGFDASVVNALGGAFADVTAMFLTGTPTISDFLGALERTGGNIGRLGGLFRQVSGYLENQMTLYQELTRSGVNFGGRFDEMGVAAIQARMSLDRLAEIARENSETIAGFGASADAGMTDFLRRSATFMDTEYATGLRRLGMTFDDINDTLMQYESILAMTGHTNRMSDAERNRAAYEFALELDTLSKLTGKQAEQIADEMRERAREGDYRAFLMGLDPEQAAAVMAQQQLADAGGYGDLFRDMMIRGVASTRDTRLQAAMMGGSVNQMAMMRSQLMAGDVAGYRQTGAGLQGVAFGEMSSEVYRATAMLSPFSDVGRAAANGLGSMSDASFRLASEFRRFSDEMGRMPTQAEMAQIQRDIEAQIREEQRTQMETPTDPNDTRNVMQAIVGVQDQILATAETVQIQATQRLYEGLAGSVAGFREQIEGFNPEIFIQRITDGLGSMLPGSGGGVPPGLEDAIERAYGLADPGAAGDEARAAAREAAEIIGRLETEDLSPADRTALSERLGELSSFLTDESGIVIDNGIVTVLGADNVTIAGDIPGGRNAGGTIGSFGNILQDFGRESLALLHGREAVLNEEQLTTLASNLLTIGRSQNIVGSLRGLVNTIAPQMQQMAMSMQANSMPQMQGLANEMLPMLEQMATQMQGPMREMAEQMRGPMEQMAGTMTRQLGFSRRSLRALQGAGNMFRGLSA